MMGNNNIQKFSFIKIFIIGLGFFTTGISWALYNSYMPIFLRDYISSSIVIGIIMALDNIVAIFFYPLIGALSDRIRTPIGRRMPFILIGIPIASLFFALIPFDKTIASFLGFSLQGNLTEAFIIRMILVMSFIIGMTIYRSPVIALTPDVTPDKHRSTANGIINLMGGVGAVFAFFVGSRLYEIDRSLPFLVTAGIMVFSLILMLIFVREPKNPPITKEKEEKVKIIPAIVEVFTEKEKSALLILFSILLWFMAYQALETWFTTYSVKTLVKIEHIEQIERTDNWKIERDSDNRLVYHSNQHDITLLDGNTVIFLSDEVNEEGKHKETVIVKEKQVIILEPDGEYKELQKDKKYKIPYENDKHLLLAQNGKTLLVGKGLEKDIRELSAKYTIRRAEKCSVENDELNFCRAVKENEASNAMTYFGLLFILVSIPAGIISKYIGRKRTIMIGIAGLIIILTVVLFIKDIDVLIWVLAFGGVFWAFININSITMMWEIATNERLGTYTGLYYFFSQAAAVVAPPLFGVFFDVIGHHVLFPVSIGFFGLAFLFMSFVKRGEYVEKTDENTHTETNEQIDSNS